ncbi:tail fiber domain-containing protein [Levilactobacillus yonginensis]
MIIATGSVDINEATKLAQIASNSADDLAEKMKNTVATMDGKTTVSTSTPFDDGKEHNEGDMWTVINDDVASAMYIYTSGEWKIKKWDQQALSVKQLSALTADLGTITAGTLESTIIEGAQITENSANGTITLDNNGFSAVSGGKYLKFVSGNDNGYTQIRGGLDIDEIDVGLSHIGGQTFTAYGGNNTHIGNANAWTYLAEGIKCSPQSYISPVSGTDIYFHNAVGTTIDIHAGDVLSHGNKLKSALSAKRDVTEYSPDEALSAVMNTDVKKWKYKDSDNSADSQHIGPIIDDVNAIGNKSASIANDMVSTDEKGNYYLNESNTISILLAALKKSNQRIDELSYRIAKLERTDSK